MELRIVMHAIGSRGVGWEAFPGGAAFAREIVNVRYDADEDCVAQTQQWWDANGECETIVRQCCVLGRDGEVDFHVNYDPYTSSVFPLNERFATYYSAEGSIDHPLGETMRPVETRRLKTRSLDSLVESAEVPAPDFLSLDTQGSEFEILMGGRATIARNTVAVLTETGLSEIYAGQKTFADIHALMLELGFELAEFRDENMRCGPMRGPVGARGKQEPLFADALYLRRPDAVPAEGGTLMLCKLGCIAAWLGHVEFALSALERARRAWDMAIEEELESYRYFAFLRELETAVAVLPEYPPTFAQVFSPDQSRDRFRAQSEPSNVQREGEHRSPGSLPMRILRRALRSLKWRLPRSRPVRILRATLRSLLLKALRWRYRRRASAPSRLESVFSAYGLDDVAKLLYEKRLGPEDYFTGPPRDLLRMLWTKR